MAQVEKSLESFVGGSKLKMDKKYSFVKKMELQNKKLAYSMYV